MSQKKRIQMKIGVIVLLLLMLLFFLIVSYRNHSDSKPSGEMIRKDEAVGLIQELADCTGVSTEELWQKLPENTLREDWYDLFDQLRTYYHVEDIIEYMQIEGLNVYTHNHLLLAIRNDSDEEICIKNVFLEESGENGITFFYKGNSLHMAVPMEAFSEGVADLVFRDGRVSRVDRKNDLVSGKLLQVTPDEIILEGKKSYRIAESCQGYETCGKLKNITRETLAIGYDFTDFVIEDGEICAYIVTHRQEMETVRVAIHNSNYNSLYHEQIELYSEQGLYVTSYDGEEKNQKRYEPMEKICISGDSDFSFDRIRVETGTNTGRIILSCVKRNQGTPSYRGSMEIFCTDKGFVLINEVLLEEYLYAVVPSEMPASYPHEALKAQAVCARTYAYGYLQTAGIPELGAHVDDSVNYQVYNNIIEQAASTNAVRETAGELLFYNEIPVSTYYYSTSCGFGTDDGIWNPENESELPYLQSTHISDGEEDQWDMTKEEVFRDYINDVHEEDYEAGEPWYRWSYEVKQVTSSQIYERLLDRNIHAEEFHKIFSIQETRRNPGGILTEITIQTDQGKITIEGEYNIRYILNAGGSVIRQDGSVYELTTILPSAYFYIVPIEKKGKVEGYKLIGGGFGHGAGMSQNGAGRMADAGKSYQDILNLFYKGCKLAKID